MRTAVYWRKAAIKARMPCTNSSIVRDCSHSSSTEENLPTDMFQAKLLLLLSLTLFQAHSAPHFKEMEDDEMELRTERRSYDCIDFKPLACKQMPEEACAVSYAIQMNCPRTCNVCNNFVYRANHAL
ncbi:hypothetical protein P5673_025602 [Acropora cervicornis]|uniref:ShKT domain-containing protein n=1 Tax=Acropora cervicornis TaxID=6130 RepID=A0AAD9UXF6_ACRCE|nr:hypothetical protein P5673_025602 [Acropora cervicornis]